MVVTFAFLSISLLAVVIKLYLYLSTGRYPIKKSLKGKHILITGGTSGIGKETVRELASHGATVHILARNLSKAEKMMEAMRLLVRTDIDVHAHELDLSSLQSVRRFADSYLTTKLPLHVLINNAGLANVQRKVTVDGNEETFQANHLGHFLLTHLLLERIIESGPGSRIINVSSQAHHHVTELDVTDPSFEHRPYALAGMVAYGCSKLENILFTRELARRLCGKGVTVNALHPGVVRTDLLRNLPWYHPLTFVMRIIMVFAKTAWEGAQTTLFLAIADEVADVSGHYFLDCKPAATSLLALNDQLASDLWDESARLVNLKGGTRNQEPEPEPEPELNLT